MYYLLIYKLYIPVKQKHNNNIYNYNIHSYTYGYSYRQLLFIPPSIDCRSILTGNNHYFGFEMICNRSRIDIDDYYFTSSNHRDQLLQEYITIDDIFNNMFGNSAENFIGYENRLYYDWNYYLDKINNNKYNFYQYSSYGSYILDEENRAKYKISPNPYDLKTVIKIEKLFSIYDIFGFIGGMYSTTSQILTYITVILIWGFSIWNNNVYIAWNDY